MTDRWHLAQLNIGVPREPFDSPLLAEFMAALDPVNEVADTSPGFVWRLQTEDGNATTIRPFENEQIAVNMSVWDSLEALRAFVYENEAHRAVLKRRRDWFERIDFHLVLWWVPAGHIPSLADAKERLARLEADGPTPAAFTFRHHFAPPGACSSESTIDDRRLCPA